MKPTRALFFALYIAAAPTNGEILFSHFPPRNNSAAAGYSNLGNITPPQQIADHFVLTSGAMITDAMWWGIYYPENLTNRTEVEFTLRFFADAGGRPGTLI